jgi:hypothetical protein
MSNPEAADRLADHVLELIASDRDFQPLGERYLEALTAVCQVVLGVLKSIDDPAMRLCVAELLEAKILHLLATVEANENRTLN